MKHFLLLVFLLAPLSGAAGEDTLRVDNLAVDSVLVYGPVEVEISQGEPTLLLVRGDQQRLQQQPFFVEGTTLVLGKSQDESRSDRNASETKFKLALPVLRSVQLIGSGDVYIKPLQVDDLSIALEGSGDMKFFAVKGRNIKVAGSGSGDIQLAELAAQTLTLVQAGSGDIVVGKLEVADLSVSLNGSGDIKLDKPASAAKVEMNIVGSGDIDFAHLDADTAVVNIVGSGTGSLGESSSMVANIMGSGVIYYRGTPTIEKTVLGSGGLHRQNQ